MHTEQLDGRQDGIRRLLREDLADVRGETIRAGAARVEECVRAVRNVCDATCGGAAEDDLAL